MFSRIYKLFSHIVESDIALSGTQSPDLREILRQSISEIAPLLGASRGVILALRPSEDAAKLGVESSEGSARNRIITAVEWSLAETDTDQDDSTVTFLKAIVRTFGKQRGAIISNDLLENPHLAQFEPLAHSVNMDRILAVAAKAEGLIQGGLILSRSSNERPWRSRDASSLEEVSYFLGRILQRVTAPENILREIIVSDDPARPETTGRNNQSTKRNQDSDAGVGIDAPYERLVEGSDAVLFSVDRDQQITFVNRRASDFFGVSSKGFLSGQAVEWHELVHLEDRERVRKHAAEMVSKEAPFGDELRVVNLITGAIRWLFVRFVPIRDRSGLLVGWDGFGIDITNRQESAQALETQSRKIHALYTVASAMRGFSDPRSIAARGLGVLCEATGADGGFCMLVGASKSGRLTLAAHQGLLHGFVEKLETLVAKLPALVELLRNGETIVVDEIVSDNRVAKLFADEVRMRSALLVPVSAEDELFGILAICSVDPVRFDGGDVLFVNAAANQIALAARQGALLAATKRQARNLAALYRLSHELSRVLSLEEVFQRAFSIIRDEVGVTRLWLGLINENGTHIIGQAAHGPGWKKQLVEVNVDITGRNNVIAEIVKNKQSMVINDASALRGAFGVKRFFTRFGITAAGLVPLVTGGQVVGVLAVQPGLSGPNLGEDELALLGSLANEIAAIVLAKRLEGRVSEGDRMRTAGLLAAGIAHNFNNLLQAVMGQASLLEMNAGNEPQVTRAARIIGEAATRGAQLVRQLVSFANLEEPQRARCDINEIIRRESPALAKLLPERQRLRFLLKQGLPLAYVDGRHVIRIVNSLVSNAGEAMRDKGGVIQIFTDVVTVHHESPHVEVPYGEYITIGVRDSGVGMDAETRKKCFEPFFTTKNVDPSSGLGLSGGGLGLAAAYALARRNGGRIVIDSRPGQGSLFTIFLPFAPRKREEGKKEIDQKFDVDSTNRSRSAEEVAKWNTLEAEVEIFEYSSVTGERVEEVRSKKAPARKTPRNSFSVREEKP